MRDPKFRELVDAGGDVEIFRPKGPLYSAFAGYIFVGLLSYTSIAYTNDDLFRVLIVSSTAILGLYILLQRPKLHMTDSGIGIENPLSSIYVPWSRVREIGTKYAMVIETDVRSIKCWAAIAPGRRSHRAIDPREMPHDMKDVAQIKAAESPRSDSGAAAHLARERIAKNSSRSGTADIHLVNHRKTQITLVCGVIATLFFAIFHS
jgi:hypothetical protein